MQVSRILTGIVALLVVGLIGVAAVGWWLWQPINAAQTKTSAFIVAPSSTTSDIGAQLTTAGLIRSPLIFKLEVKRQNLDAKLKAGSFALSPSMSVSQIAQTLANSNKLNGVWVTIPEGKRREEVADIIAKTQLPNFDAQDFVEETENKEGYLFPDTYLVPEQASASAVIKTMTNTFDQKVTEDLATKLQASSHSEADIITMASIVEREAKSYDDMRTVAGILWKRISIGMPLQSDVTVEYLHGYDTASKSWWGNSTAQDRQSSSPFNSYLTLGLPPHPISNPGLNAINATLDPVETDDLFYLSDNQGKIHTAKTLAEHNANIAKYLR